MKLSIILPTYNNEKTIRECLTSISKQDFPKNQIELLIIDGGSNDKTVETAKKFWARIIKNPFKVEEKGRIIGIKKARGEILCFIDADNILVGKDWIRKMLKPFEDKEIAFADTLYYSYRKKDKLGVRYQALIGGDDPLVAYLGFYSRWNYFKEDWTDYPYLSEDKKGYLKIKLKNKNKVPAMGSNGFLVRKSLARKFVKDSFIHSDFIYDLVNSDFNCFAKVKIGIIHNQPKFFSNKIRRIKRRINNEVKLNYNYDLKKSNIIKTTAYIFLVLPILYDAIRGFIKKPSLAWFFHPVACFGELLLHGYYNIKYKILRRA